MKSKTPKGRGAGLVEPDHSAAIAGHTSAQSPEHSGICDALRAMIDAALPTATSKIWHGMPVWFIGGNPVVGYKATPKHVNLLFWNGQSFGEPALKAAGKFKAAQVQFTEASQIDPNALRRWLMKAGRDIWDYQAHFTSKKALQKKKS
jgi:hypothetical protein